MDAMNSNALELLVSVSLRAVSQAPIYTVHDFFESAFWELMEALMRHQLYDRIWQVYYQIPFS